MILLIDLGTKGGLPKYAKHIRDEFRNSGISFLCIQSINNYHRQTDSIIFKTYSNKLGFILNSILRLPFLLLYFSKIINKNNINTVYFPYFHLWSIFFILLCKIKKCQTVFTVHDAIMHAGDSNKLESLLLRLSVENADKLIFLTKCVKNQAYTNFKLEGKQSTVIPHGLFNLENLVETKIKDKASLNYLFFGRVSKYKGVELLLDAFNNNSELSNHSLTIAGKSNYQIDYKKYSGIRSLNVDDRFLEESEIVEYLNNSDIIVLPYLEATQSGVITFAIQSIKPLIVSSVGGLTEQVGENAAIFFDPQKGKLVNHLTSIQDVEIRTKLSNNMKILKLALQWDKIARDIVSFIRQ